MPHARDATALLEELSARWGQPGDAPKAASMIQESLGSLASTLPELELEVPVLADGLVRAVGAHESPWVALEGVHWAELALTAASLAGSPVALRLFAARYLSRLEPTVARRLSSSADREDTIQTVREKVLLGGDRTLAYAGRGALAVLVNLIASRSAIDRHRRRQARPDQTQSADARVIETLLDAGLTPELAAARRRHHSTFKAAFAAALAALSPQDRGLLRLSLLQRLSIDEVAALQDVHRATAARRIARVRDALADRVRRELRFGAGLSQTELRSLHQALDSQLDLSLSRLLTPEDRESNG